MSAVIDEVVWRPAPAALRPYVAGYSGYRQSGIPPVLHRGLPSQYLTLIFTLHDPLVITQHSDPRRLPGQYDALVGGLHTRPAHVAHGGSQSGVQVYVSPLGARALLGARAGDLAGIDVEAAEVVGPLVAEIRDRLLAAGDWAERMAELERIVTRRVAEAEAHGCRWRSADAVRPEVRHAWHWLLRSGGQVRVSDLASQTGWSARYLRERFAAEIGLTPKAAARVIRFDRARRLLLRGLMRPEANTRGARPTLAAVAADCGYYDQAHLDREFRALAGCPPSTWITEEFGIVQAFAAALHAD